MHNLYNALKVNTPTALVAAGTLLLNNLKYSKTKLTPACYFYCKALWVIITIMWGGITYCPASQQLQIPLGQLKYLPCLLPGQIYKNSTLLYINV